MTIAARKLEDFVRESNRIEGIEREPTAQELLASEFEMLHPYLDGNGRTGRILWAWQMENQGREAFQLPFPHMFYYQTLNRVKQ